MKDEKKIRSARTFAWLVLSILAALLILSSLPMETRTDSLPKKSAVVQIKHLVIACRVYAADYDGEVYPPLRSTLFIPITSATRVSSTRSISRKLESR